MGSWKFGRQEPAHIHPVSNLSKVFAPRLIDDHLELVRLSNFFSSKIFDRRELSSWPLGSMKKLAAFMEHALWLNTSDLCMATMASP